MQKSLDQKLAAIHADPSGSKEFILADAKDADMAFGIGAPGLSPEMHAGEVRVRTLAEYREQIREIARQGIVDIMLMSASTNDVLTIQERLFENSHITPAARANDTSDIFVARGGGYVLEPSRPFRTAALDHIQCGHVECRPDERVLGANLGLYSITFNNRLDEDLWAIEEYRKFRLEAEAKGFRHFLEIFDPNSSSNLSAADVPKFINDLVARTLAGVAQAGRPLFLKVVYHGPKAMEELVSYDPHLVVGIMGGGSGTTYDAFKLIAEARKYGARAALFGRKINNAECQLAFVHFLRLIVEGAIGPEEAVRAYHAVLEKLAIRPQRSLQDDLVLQTAVMSYGGSSTVAVPAGVPRDSESLSKNPIVGRAAGPSEAKDGPTGRPTVALPPQGFRIGSEPASGSGHAHCGCGGSSQEVCSCKTSPAGEAEDALPDFSRMTQAEKLAYNKAKRDRIFGTLGG